MRSGVILIIFFMIFPFAGSDLLGNQDFDSLSQSGFRLEALSLFAESKPDTIEAGQTLTIRIWGRINSGFHIYSVKTQGEFAPIPTQFILESNDLNAVTDFSESKTETIYDAAFDQELQVHTNDFWLEQDYRVSDKLAPGIHRIEGVLFFQICDNRICSLPLEKEFSTQFDVQ